MTALNKTLKPDGGRKQNAIVKLLQLIRKIHNKQNEYTMGGKKWERTRINIILHNKFKHNLNLIILFKYKLKPA